MNIINIPFRQDMQDAIDAGEKTATTRRKRYGNPGDRFQVRGKWYELVEVSKKELSRIAVYHWREEGMTSTQHFWRVWDEIHPRKQWLDGELVWFHTFRRVEE